MSKARKFLRRLGAFILFEIISMIPILNFIFVADLMFEEKTKRQRVIKHYEEEIEKLKTGGNSNE